MNEIVSYGWRKTEESSSSGLDFLGLTIPIERILDRWTPGITNATNRARFFSFVPWVVYEYASLGGQGNSKEQRVFIRAFETFFALTNTAHETETGIPVTGGIRSTYAREQWKKGIKEIRIRGTGVPSSPSAFDAANYGPSFSRFHLVGANGKLRTSLQAGIEMAEIIAEAVPNLKKLKSLYSSDIVKRSDVLRFHESLNLNNIPRKEITSLRKLIFASEPFNFEDTFNRVKTLVLILFVIAKSKHPISTFDVESVMAGGRYTASKNLKVTKPLTRTYSRWRMITLLKLLRHAAEIAFKGLHLFIGESADWYRLSGDAAAKLSQIAATEFNAKTFGKLVADELTQFQLPSWNEEDEIDELPVAKVVAGINLMSWCAARLKESDVQALFEDPAAQTGGQTGAGLVSYAEELKRIEGLSVDKMIQWLLIDRGLARHNRVAAKKLWQHNTFRIVDDENGAVAYGECPIPDIAVRVGSMLSLMTDLGLLSALDRTYSVTTDGNNFLERQLNRLSEYEK